MMILNMLRIVYVNTIYETASASMEGKIHYTRIYKIIVLFFFMRRHSKGGIYI